MISLHLLLSAIAELRYSISQVCCRVFNLITFFFFLMDEFSRIDKLMRTPGIQQQPCRECAGFRSGRTLQQLVLLMSCSLVKLKSPGGEGWGVTSTRLAFHCCHPQQN